MPKKVSLLVQEREISQRDSGLWSMKGAAIVGLVGAAGTGAQYCSCVQTHFRGYLYLHAGCTCIPWCICYTIISLSVCKSRAAQRHRRLNTTVIVAPQPGTK